MRHSPRLSLSILAASALIGSGNVSDRVLNEPALRGDPQLPLHREAMLNQDEDPPAWVARLNYIQGSVSFRPGEWTTGLRPPSIIPYERATTSGWMTKAGPNCTWVPPLCGWVHALP